MQFTQVPLPSSLLQLTRPPCTPTCSLSCSCPQKALSSTNESIVNVGSWSFLMSGQHSHSSCLPLQSLSLPGRCRDCAAVVRAPCCWPCCFRPPWKCVVGAWRVASVRTSPRKVTCWYVGCGRHLDLGIRWYWGGDSTKKGACKRGDSFSEIWLTQSRAGIDL